MQILLIHAHPEPRAFCSALKDQAVATLSQQGHTVVVSDLYAMQFNPVAQRSDFLGMHDDTYLQYALQQREAYTDGNLAPDIIEQLDRVMAADIIIFNFPLFWGSVPAIMKGWIDRVLISGVCYGGKRFYDQGGLAGKIALVCVTTGGRDYMFTHDGIHGALTDMLKPLLQHTLAYVGMRVLEPFAAYHVPYVSNDVRCSLLQDYARHLSTLSQQPALVFPQLADYDTLMRKRS